jgi:hypothetical protein
MFHSEKRTAREIHCERKFTRRLARLRKSRDKAAERADVTALRVAMEKIYYLQVDRRNKLESLAKPA